MTPPETWTCQRCRVTYRIAEPPQKRTERLQCSDCNKPFWCRYGAGDERMTVTVGMREKPNEQGQR